MPNEVSLIWYAPWWFFISYEGMGTYLERLVCNNIDKTTLNEVETGHF